jgi:ADP-ribosylglycohydrolase
MLIQSAQFDANSINEYGDHNLSNGMMMRASPWGILIAGMIKQIQQKFDRNLTKQEFDRIVQMVRKDTELTHYSQEALYYVVAYVFLIAYCILDGNMNRGTNIITQYLDKSIGDWYKIFNNGFIPSAKLAHSPQEKIGDVRIAFQLAIRKALYVQEKYSDLQFDGSTLKPAERHMDFAEAIISTVKLGGDTDTNACIVGGLCGAIVGTYEIPRPWIETLKSDQVLNCERYNKYRINKQVQFAEYYVRKLLICGEILVEKY